MQIEEDLTIINKLHRVWKGTKSLKETWTNEAINIFHWNDGKWNDQETREKKKLKSKKKSRHFLINKVPILIKLSPSLSDTEAEPKFRHINIWCWWKWGSCVLLIENPFFYFSLFCFILFYFILLEFRSYRLNEDDTETTWRPNIEQRDHGKSKNVT